jgi:hypothetical protein
MHKYFLVTFSDIEWKYVHIKKNLLRALKTLGYNSEHIKYSKISEIKKMQTY